MNNPREDEAAVDRILQGDPDAFAGIVRRWQGPLINLAYRFCGERGRAEEMAQEAFLRCFRSLAQWRRDATFSTWLFAVATNLYRREVRRIPPRTVSLEDIVTPSVPGDLDSMNDDEIESILAGEDEILPSSGFAASVMEAVHQKVITLPPLAFPWRRAVPGMVALLAAFGMAIWRFIAVLNNATSKVPLDEQLHQLSAVGTRSEIQWIIIAIAVTIVSVLLPLRLMRGCV